MNKNKKSYVINAATNMPTSMRFVMIAMMNNFVINTRRHRMTESIYEKVAKRIANEVGGKCYANGDENWIVESKHKKDWTIDYADDPANKDLNKKWMVEAYNDYKLEVQMHPLEAMRLIKLEDAQDGKRSI